MWRRILSSVAPCPTGGYIGGCDQEQEEIESPFRQREGVEDDSFQDEVSLVFGYGYCPPPYGPAYRSALRTTSTRRGTRPATECSVEDEVSLVLPTLIGHSEVGTVTRVAHCKAGSTDRLASASA
jgi:hypothetical protein